MMIDVLQTKHYFAVCVFFQSIFVSKHYYLLQNNYNRNHTSYKFNTVQNTRVCSGRSYEYLMIVEY